eukprot:TRINITY_DN14514_c0_g1_i1.p1 TRINITY_DN14514_c0_g1~~TRINITY_DN14514_c0_g1_i1.p1  ORF type:complete len:150 (+),score=12.01 TRINITY_DN14514_c0_g1_i1:51-452(+)
MAWARYGKAVCYANAFETFVCALVEGVNFEHQFSALSVFVLVSSTCRTAALLSLVAAYRRNAHLTGGVAGSLQCCSWIWLLCSHGTYSLLPVAILSLAITFATGRLFLVMYRMQDIADDGTNDAEVNIPAEFL